MSNPNGLSPSPEAERLPVASAAHPTPAPPRRRGGRREGAGAPKGNTNALKHGLYSRQVRYVTLLLAAVPEFRALFIAVKRAQSSPDRVSVTRALAGAAQIVVQDKELAKSIRKLTAQRVEKALAQTQKAEGFEAFANNEQTIKPATEAPPTAAPPPQSDLALQLQALLDMAQTLARRRTPTPSAVDTERGELSNTQPRGGVLPLSAIAERGPGGEVKEEAPPTNRRGL